MLIIFSAIAYKTSKQAKEEIPGFKYEKTYKLIKQNKLQECTLAYELYNKAIEDKLINNKEYKRYKQAYETCQRTKQEYARAIEINCQKALNIYSKMQEDIRKAENSDQSRKIKYEKHWDIYTANESCIEKTKDIKYIKSKEKLIALEKNNKRG